MHFAHFSGKNAPFSVVIVPFYWFSSFFYPVFNPYAKDNPHIQIRVRFQGPSPVFRSYFFEDNIKLYLY